MEHIKFKILNSPKDGYNRLCQQPSTQHANQETYSCSVCCEKQQSHRHLLRKARNDTAAEESNFAVSYNSFPSNNNNYRRTMTKSDRILPLNCGCAECKIELQGIQEAGSQVRHTGDPLSDTLLADLTAY
jgi:hypothetical protein